MKKVQVYRNLHRTEEDGTHVYSVRNDKGIVEDHVTTIALSRPILRVGPKGNQRVRDEKRKNVHAYIQGMKMKESLIDDYGTGIELCEWQKITYNPYKHKSFVLVKDESVAVREAWFVEIRRDGVWAYLPEPSTTGTMYRKTSWQIPSGGLPPSKKCQGKNSLIQEKNPLTNGQSCATFRYEVWERNTGTTQRESQLESRCGARHKPSQASEWFRVG